MALVIEGTIGAGKSTLLQTVRTLYPDQYLIRPEPVRNWTEGDNILAQFYANPTRYAFQFETNCLLDTTQPAEGMGWDTTLLQERSFYGALYVFSTYGLNHQHLTPDQFKLLTRLAERLVRDNPVKAVFYLKTDAQTACTRVRQRARPEERNISPEYLAEITRLYDHLFTSCAPSFNIPIMVVDASAPTNELARALKSFADSLPFTLGEIPRLKLSGAGPYQWLSSSVRWPVLAGPVSEETREPTGQIQLEFSEPPVTGPEP